MILYRSKQKMANYKRLYSAVKASEKIMNQWSDDEGNEADVVVLPPEKVDFLTGDEDINKDQVDRQGLPNDVCGNIQIQTNQPDADSANDDVDSVKESSWSSKTDQPSTNFPDVSSDADQKEKKGYCFVRKDWKWEKQSNYLEKYFTNKNPVIRACQQWIENSERFEECNYGKIVEKWSFWEVCQCRSERDDCYRNKPLLRHSMLYWF